MQSRITLASHNIVNNVSMWKTGVGKSCVAKWSELPIIVDITLWI